MLVFAIDPGPEESAFLMLDDHGRVHDPWIGPNPTILSWAGSISRDHILAIERFMPYGQRLGVDSLETVWWSGAFAAEYARRGGKALRIPRADVKSHLLGRASGKGADDAAVRQVLIDRFGGTGGRSAAIGKKASPGPLYGIKTHLWAALAVAVTAADLPEKWGEWRAPFGGAEAAGQEWEP